MVPTTTYTASSRLRKPRQFFKEIVMDLPHAWGLGTLLFTNHIKTQFKQSWLGYFWLIMPPLVTALIWIFLHGFKIFDIADTGLPYPVFVICGIFLWQSFVEMLNSPIQQIKGSKQLVTKLKMPHEALFLAGMLGVLFNLGLRLLIILLVLLFFQIPFSATFFLAPIGIFLLLLFGFSMGLLLTPLGVMYQDISLGLGVLTSVLFFTTPIVYPIPKTPFLEKLLNLNPLTHLITVARDSIAMQSISWSFAFLITAVGTIICFFVAWFLYRIAQPHLIERL